MSSFELPFTSAAMVAAVTFAPFGEGPATYHCPWYNLALLPATRLHFDGSRPIRSPAQYAGGNESRCYLVRNQDCIHVRPYHLLLLLFLRWCNWSSPRSLVNNLCRRQFGLFS